MDDLAFEFEFFAGKDGAAEFAFLHGGKHGSR